MKNKSDTQVLKNGSWIDAVEEPYYPSKMESFLHWFGIHVLTYTNPRYCIYPDCLYIKAYERQ